MTKSHSIPELRYYQRDAVNALFSYFEKNDGNPLVVIPTAGGKSMAMGEFVRLVFSWPHQRVMLLTHVKELIEQDHAAILRMWPQAMAGIYSASLGLRDAKYPITVAGIQSVHKKAHMFNWIDLVLIDEAHLLSGNDDAMYQKFLASLRKVNPKLKVIGFTATPYRMKEGLLVDSGIFTDIAYEIGVRELVEQGYLAPLISKSSAVQVNTSELKVSGGEFTRQSMELAMDKDDLTEAALDEVFRFGADRKSWLFFCAGVDHAMHVRDALRARGIHTECLTGETPKQERERIVEAFKAGRLKALTNCDVLTTGFDAPALDLLVLLRPTKSPGLYVQILGRGMRWIGGNREVSMAAGKSNCLVLDFAGNIERFGPIDNIQIAKKRKRKGDLSIAPTKICQNPDCRAPNPIQAHECKECGHPFPESTIPPHEETASSLEIMSGGAPGMVVEPEVLPVDRIFYDEYMSRAGHMTLQVRYACGLQEHREWICFEHDAGSMPRRKAEQWWRDRTSQGGMVPPTVRDAVFMLTGEGHFREPVRIRVMPDIKNPKYKRIVGYEWH